jgi:hypothetical protein
MLVSLDYAGKEQTLVEKTLTSILLEEKSYWKSH